MYIYVSKGVGAHEAFVPFVPNLAHLSDIINTTFVFDCILVVENTTTLCSHGRSSICYGSSSGEGNTNQQGRICQQQRQR